MIKSVEMVRIYKKGGKLPIRNSLKQKLLMRLCNVLYMIDAIRKVFLRSYNLPLNTVLGSGFSCSAPWLEIEENVILGKGLFIVAYAPIKIGHDTMFSFNNTIITSTHDPEDMDTIIGKPITIGHNVWITTNVTILPGVTIGDNSIIGAGSVITRDIPTGVFAAGNPCKVIRKIIN